MKKTINVCDECGNTYEDKDKYEKGILEIKGSSLIFLPIKIVKKHHRAGFGDSHILGLDGDYCSLKCFISKIKKYFGER